MRAWEIGDGPDGRRVDLGRPRFKNMPKRHLAGIVVQNDCVRVLALLIAQDYECALI